MNKKIMYLCLQATKQGQASYAHVHEIINGLKKRNCHVDLYEPAYTHNRQLPGAFGRLAGFIAVQIKLMFNVRGSVLYVRSHFAAFPTALIAKFFRIPIVQEVNGPYEDLFISWPWTSRIKCIFKWLIRTQLRWADAVIAVTENLKDWVYDETGNRNISIIPNGANIELFHPNADLRKELPKPYAVFFGALAQWQGIDTILEAVNCPLWPEELSLVIMGDGSERVKVEKAAQENSRVIYLGTVPYTEVPGIVANSMVGLSPQNNIGNRSDKGLFPLKVFETLACGVPVIVTDFKGQADLVREYNCGFIIASNNPKSLIMDLKYLLENEEIGKEMGRRGYLAVKKEHSWDKRSVDTMQVISRLSK